MWPFIISKNITSSSLNTLFTIHLKGKTMKLLSPLLFSLLFSVTACSAFNHDTELLNDYFICQNYIPIHTDKLITGHDSVNIILNGVEGVFIVDTGAAETVLHKGFLPKYHITESTKSGSEAAGGLGGKVDIDFYTNHLITLDNNTFMLPSIAATDLSAIFSGLKQTTGVQIDGIIGQDILMSHQGIIDISNNKLFLKPKSTQSDIDNTPLSSSCQENFSTLLLQQQYVMVPMTKLNSGLETINATINKTHGLFVLDSGAGRSVIHNKRLTKYQFSPTDQIGTQASSGAGGFVSLQRYTLQAITLDGFTFPISNIAAGDLTVVVDYLEQESSVNIDGVIGQDILSTYQAIIDVSGGRLFLQHHGN